MQTPEINSRDLQIIKFTALNLTRKQIAEKLGISIKTLEFHLNGTENKNSLCARLKLNSPAEITRFAVERGLVKPGDQPPDDAKPPKPVSIEIKGIEDLKSAVLRGATLSANGTSDVLQINALCQCSDAYIRLARLQMDAAMTSRTITP
jgi:DNA-binding CsgD family transcriptional regulator